MNCSPRRVGGGWVRFPLHLGFSYFAAEIRFFSLGTEQSRQQIFVRRDYYHLVGHPTLLKGKVYGRLPCDRETIAWWERVEVVDSVETKND